MIAIATLAYWMLTTTYSTQIYPDVFDGKEWDASARSELELQRMLLKGWSPQRGRLQLPNGTGNLNAIRFPNESAITGLLFDTATIKRGDLKELSRFRNMDVIVFADCNLENGCIDALPAWKALRGIEVTQSRIDDKDLESVCVKYGKSLEYLNIASNTISDSGLKAITRVKRLRVLNITGTRVTDQSLDTICQCRHLEWLVIILPKDRFSSRNFPTIRNAIPGIEIIAGDLQ